MLEQLEALSALAEEGTMGRAGLRLRISQSAISKRVASLEGWLGRPLTARRGRRVELTPAGRRLLQRAGPLVRDLRAALAEEEAGPEGRVTLGVSESALSSWGAHLLARTQKALPKVHIEVHAHRSPVVIDRVQAGEYLLGMVAGAESPGMGLQGSPLLKEPMVVIPSGQSELKVSGRKAIEILTIEPNSSTWSEIAPQARKLKLVPSRTLESFFAVAQAALAGLGHGLVPLGVARALKIEEGGYVRLPKQGIQRSVWLVGRPRGLARTTVSAVVDQLAKEVQAGVPLLD